MSLNNSTLICMIVMIIYLIQSKSLGNIIAKLASILNKGGTPFLLIRMLLSEICRNLK
ncbi:hypothetical protein J2780_002413 [Chryseobacterium camelliae]|nr:hypothetical protein [Chryseobacterium camelliae]